MQRTRKIVVGLVVLAVIAVVWRRCGGAEMPATSRSVVSVSRTELPARAIRTAGRHGWVDAVPEGGLRLEGQVLGPDGAPVAGAEVSLGRRRSRTAISEADGSFAFDHLIAESYFVSATSGLLVGGPVIAVLTAKSDPIVVRLDEATSAVVVVVDEARRPIAGAEVDVRTGTPVERVVKTGADGRVAIAPIAIGFLGVEVSAAGYAPAIGSLTLATAGASGELAITLHPGVAVSGRVIDEGGAPIAGARIEVFDPRGGRLDAAAATSDAGGGFAIATLARGIYALRASDDAHAPARSMPVGVTGAPVTGVTIVMTAAGVLRGRVVDLAHAPVPFASVSTLATDVGPGWIEPRGVSADAEGRFVLGGLERHAVEVIAETPSGRSTPVIADLVAHPALELELVIDAVAVIAGKVVDGAGAPVAEVQVSASADPYAFGSAAPAKMPSVNRPRTAITRGDGSFEIAGLDAGSYRISATRHPSMFRPFGDPGAGTPARTGDRNVRVTLLATGTLIGKVVLAGSATPPRDVTAALSGQAPVAARADGTFEIKGITAGMTDVFVRSPDCADLYKRGIEIKPGETTDIGTLEANRGRVLLGKVVDAAGAPVVGAKVRIGVIPETHGAVGRPSEPGFGTMSPQRETATGADGSFTIYGVPPYRSRPPMQIMAYEPERGTSPLVELPVGAGEPPAMTLTIGAPGPRP